MVSEIQEQVQAESPEVYIPGFGLLESKYVEEGKKYQGRLYRLSSENVKTLAEIVGFTARFDAPSIREAYLDVVKAEAYLHFEIDRNTNPTELGLRYGRDRWSTVEIPGKSSAYALRPWIKTTYVARYLPEKVLFSLCEQLRIKFDEREKMYIRVNFKDRTYGAITEDQNIEELPTGAFEVFALPAGHVAAIPTAEVEGGAAPAAAAAAETPRVQRAAQESGPKYATYSMSEIDRMFKMQTENITNTLSAKISSHQRMFQESVAQQEKAFARLADKLAAQVEETRTRLESHTKTAQESAKRELDEVVSQLGKELEQFKTHVNKNVVPIPKAIEDKVSQMEAAVRETGRDDVRPVVIGVAVAIIVAVVASTGLLYTSLTKSGELSGLKAEITSALEKIAK